MKKLPKPTQTASATFLKCISRVKNAALKARLTAVEPNIVTMATAYDALAPNTQLHTILEHTVVGIDIEVAEMEAVYTDRMAKLKALGREIYEEIKASTAICPLCSQRDVSTLDHYLPKSKFPGLAVVPVNLIPACFECNDIKATRVCKTKTEEMFHPYYDDFETGRWLQATLLKDIPPAIMFSVKRPANWDQLTYSRVLHHFSVLELGKLYSIQAAAELVDIRGELSTIFDGGAGESGVKQHLYTAFLGREDARLNSWKTAAYQALYNSQWYCRGGFKAFN